MINRNAYLLGLFRVKFNGTASAATDDIVRLGLIRYIGAGISRWNQYEEVRKIFYPEVNSVGIRGSGMVNSMGETNASVLISVATV